MNMRRTLLLILLCEFYRCALFGQQVGHIEITYIDSNRANRAIQTEIYYPTATAGNNVPITPGIFPLIVFGHGFVMDWSAYQNFWDSLVMENYILAFPTTESSFSPVHLDFADDLKYLVNEIRNTGVGNIILPSAVANQSAIMGHSMGGGCSFLAAENNTSITTMVSFAAANTTPSSITASENISVPTLLFSGTNDCVAPPSQHQDLMYDSCSSTFKTQIYVTGGGHCYFANSNTFCSIGEGTCSPAPTISRNEEQDVVNNFLKLWLAYYLKGECNKAQEFQDSLSLSNRITFRQNQPLSCLSVVDDIYAVAPFNIFPNPGNDIITISSGSKISSSVKIFDVAMAQVRVPVQFVSDRSFQLDISSLTNGTYIIQIEDSKRKLFFKN